jgi:hypothetical protein
MSELRHSGGVKFATDGAPIARAFWQRKGSSYMTSVDSVDCKSLSTGSRVDVETRSRHYQIECLGGNAIRISGHPEYCPSPVPGKLEGAFEDEGTLELGRIERGMRFRFLLDDDRYVTTSRVLSVHVDQP